MKKRLRCMHGMTGTPLYKKWAGMKRRCNNKNEKEYKNYGMKGVKLCKEWDSNFTNFFNDMVGTYFPKASIDRIDNTKGYCKENCRWVELSEQSRNKASVKKYNFENNLLTINQLEEKLGFKMGTLRRRINNYGWSFEKAITTPVKTTTSINFDKARSKYKVEFKSGGQRHFVGRFDSYKEAELALAKYKTFLNGRQKLLMSFIN